MSGTPETTEETKPNMAGPENLPDEVRVKLAEIRERDGGGEVEAQSVDLAEVDADPNFGDLAESEGIEVTRKPKEKAKEAQPEAAEDAPREDPPDVDGFDLLGKPSGAREAKIETKRAMEAEALELGLPPSVAKALAHSAKTKESRDFLDSLRKEAHDSSAGQPAPQPPVREAVPAAELAEVQTALQGEVGEEAASATLRFLERQDARLEALERQNAELRQATEAESVRAQVAPIVGELREQFPDLVRDGRLDPEVAADANALYRDGSRAGDWRAALTAACAARFGVGKADRQDTSDLTPERDVEHPTEYRERGDAKPIDKHEERDMLAAVFKQYPNDKGKREAAFKRIRQRVERSRRRA